MTKTEWLTCTDPQKMLTYLAETHLAPDEQYGWTYSQRKRRTSDRKLRLLAVAICRQGIDFQDGISEYALKSVERWAETGHAPPHTIIHSPIESYVFGAKDPLLAVRESLAVHPQGRNVQADLLRHIVGNPYRPWNAVTCWDCGGHGGYILPVGATHRTAANGMSSADYLSEEGKGWRIDTNAHWEKHAACSGRGWLPGKSLPPLPRIITDLAQALYDGTDCAHALADALLAEGHEELGLHFTGRRRLVCEVDCGIRHHPHCTLANSDGWIAIDSTHPRGCWALDLILGKE